MSGAWGKSYDVWKPLGDIGAKLVQVVGGGSGLVFIYMLYKHTLLYDGCPCLPFGMATSQAFPNKMPK